EYADALPGPEDVLLVIEIADTSLATDRDVKARLYGTAGIPEYWLVDLAARAITVYRQPGPNGYGSTRTVGRDGTLDLLAFLRPKLILSNNPHTGIPAQNCIIVAWRAAFLGFGELIQGVGQKVIGSIYSLRRAGLKNCLCSSLADDPAVVGALILARKRINQGMNFGIADGITFEQPVALG
ncbi:MAG: hypothetical protein DCC75_02190, partial [Proteobacteria bacterium]